jgi:hypothetical protein
MLTIRFGGADSPATASDSSHGKARQTEPALKN